MDDQPELAAVDALRSLVGTWRGGGTVQVPSMATRAYVEEVRFAVRSPTSLDYWQRATDPVEGSLLHSEAGIWRSVGPDAFEVSVALPGATEVAEGRAQRGVIMLSSTAVGRAANGTPLVGTARRYDVRGDVIAYEIGIASEAFPIFAHLRGELHRSAEAG